MGRAAGQLIHSGGDVSNAGEGGIEINAAYEGAGGGLLTLSSSAPGLPSKWTVSNQSLQFKQGLGAAEYTRIQFTHGGANTGGITLNSGDSALFKTVLGDTAPTMIMSASQSTGLFNIRGGTTGQLSLNDSNDAPRVVVYADTSPKLVLSGNGASMMGGIHIVMSGGTDETYAVLECVQGGTQLQASSSNLTLYATGSTWGASGTVRFQDQYGVNNASWGATGASPHGRVNLSSNDAEWTTLASTFTNNSSLIAMLAEAATTTSPPTSTMAGLWLATGRIVSGTALEFESSISPTNWGVADDTYGGSQIGQVGQYGIPAGVTAANYTKVIDAYVNGNLLVSGSTIKVGVAAADYHLGTYSATTGEVTYPSGSITFGFDLEDNDTVLLKVR
jgi:hypothetical protein